MKICNKCNVEKPFGEFNKRKDSPDGYRGECRECNGIKCKNWYWNNRDRSLNAARVWRVENREWHLDSKKKWQKDNPEKRSIIQKRYREKHLEKITIKSREYRMKHRDELAKKRTEWRLSNPDSNMRQRLKHYGITLEQYNDMYDRQNGKCAICEKEYGRIALKSYQRLFVDHCHKTGAFRGLLCGKCNNAIGYLDDRIDLMKKAIEYLIPFNSGSL